MPIVLCKFDGTRVPIQGITALHNQQIRDLLGGRDYLFEYIPGRRPCQAFYLQQRPTSEYNETASRLIKRQVCGNVLLVDLKHYSVWRIDLFNRRVRGHFASMHYDRVKALALATGQADERTTAFFFPFDSGLCVPCIGELIPRDGVDVLVSPEGHALFFDSSKKTGANRRASLLAGRAKNPICGDVLLRMNYCTVPEALPTFEFKRTQRGDAAAETKHMNERLGTLTASVMHHFFDRDRFGSVSKGVCEIFQTPKPADPDRDVLMAIGNLEEAETLRLAAERFGYKYVDEPQRLRRDKEYHWIGATFDARTATIAIEAKFHALHADEEVKPMPDGVPAWRLDQCMTQLRVGRPEGIVGVDLLERSHRNMERAQLRPTEAEYATYWSTADETLRGVYQRYLAWYWERDLSKFDETRALLLEAGWSEAQVEALAEEALTGPHATLYPPYGSREKAPSGLNGMGLGLA